VFVLRQTRNFGSIRPQVIRLTWTFSSRQSSEGRMVNRGWTQACCRRPVILHAPVRPVGCGPEAYGRYESTGRTAITWVERCGNGDTLYEECIAVTGTGGSPTGQAAVTSNITQTNRGATPFACYVDFECSPVGLQDAQSVATDGFGQGVRGTSSKRRSGPGRLERPARAGLLRPPCSRTLPG